MRIAAFVIDALLLLVCLLNSERGVRHSAIWEAGIFASLGGLLTLAVTA